ncbi:hypothetical protein HK104_005203, partial [Borealophlyctis nickersoniae]
MSSTTAANADEFLEEYLESISNLPAELHFTLTSLRDLDDRFHTLCESMRSHAKSYAASYARSQTEDAPTTRSVLGDYRREYVEVLKQADRKVAMSQGMLDQFNSHLARLDRELNRLSKDPAEESGGGSSFKRRRTTLGFGEDKRRDDATPLRKRVKSNMDSISPSYSSVKANRNNSLPASPRKSGSVSEDEALYCICRQVSYGDMVGCDNED